MLKSADHFPHTCKLCGSPSYTGDFSTDCSKPGCSNHQGDTIAILKKKESNLLDGLVGEYKMDDPAHKGNVLEEGHKECLKKFNYFATGFSPLHVPVASQDEEDDKMCRDFAENFPSDNELIEYIGAAHSKIQSELPEQTWDLNPPKGIGYTEHKLSIVDKLQNMSSQVFRRVRLASEETIHAGMEVISVFQALPGFKPDKPVDGRVKNSGTLQGRWRVHGNTELLDHEFRMLSHPNGSEVEFQQVCHVTAMKDWEPKILEKTTRPGDEPDRVVGQLWHKADGSTHLWNGEQWGCLIQNPHAEFQSDMRAAFQKYMEAEGKEINPHTQYEVKYEYWGGKFDMEQKITRPLNPNPKFSSMVNRTPPPRPLNAVQEVEPARYARIDHVHPVNIDSRSPD